MIDSETHTEREVSENLGQIQRQRESRILSGSNLIFLIILGPQLNL